MFVTPTSCEISNQGLEHGGGGTGCQLEDAFASSNIHMPSTRYGQKK
jgi:hypothetical protein